MVTTVGDRSAKLNGHRDALLQLFAHTGATQRGNKLDTNRGDI
jgi:hypothetical protein